MLRGQRSTASERDALEEQDDVEEMRRIALRQQFEDPAPRHRPEEELVAGPSGADSM